jgi:hypothetical protein
MTNVSMGSAAEKFSITSSSRRESYINYPPLRSSARRGGKPALPAQAG